MDDDLLHYSRFAVDEKAYCVWEWDLRQRNTAFLNKLDPWFFEYLAHTHYRQPELEANQRAAIALRLAYSHGLEALFSLLFATLQAPDCIGGWLLRYSAGDLRSLVVKVGRGRKVYSKVALSSVSWKAVAAVIHGHIDRASEDKGAAPDLALLFGNLWSRFARDYLDELQSQEYNSLKHGLRVAPGGFHLRIGRQPEEGVPAPPAAMRPAGGSEYGSTFFKREHLTDDKRHFRTRWQSVNWNPENHFHGLRLLAVSMHNVIAFAKLVTGAAPPEDLAPKFPEDEDYFRSPWRNVVTARAFDIDRIIPPESIVSLSDQEILAVYDREEGTPEDEV